MLSYTLTVALNYEKNCERIIKIRPFIQINVTDLPMFENIT